jgi:predicted  nucleic acid-binding Zn-ribbon protein
VIDRSTHAATPDRRDRHERDHVRDRHEDKYIDRLQKDKDRLEGEKQELMDALVDVMRTAHRGADAADDAARELMKQRRRKP